MTRLLLRSARLLLVLGLVLVLALGGVAIAARMGWLSVFGIESKSHDSQVVQAIERTQEVSLVGLGIQGIMDEERSRTAFGHDIPGTSERFFLQYRFTAKLGVDGAEVTVSETGEKEIVVSVPEFIFIGYDEPTFEVAAQDGGLLSWATPDIDPLEMVNKILDDDAQQKYLDDHRELLEEQVQVFYDGLIAGIDPEIVTTFEFAS